MASFIWQRRGRFAFLLLALTAVWFVVIGTRSTGPALATSDVNPYVVPETGTSAITIRNDNRRAHDR